VSITTVADMVGKARALQEEINVIAPPPKVTAATQPTLVVRMWRCSVCGKWSHAKRKPKKHEVWDHQEGDWADCGPFETWEAWEVTDGRSA